MSREVSCVLSGYKILNGTRSYLKNVSNAKWLCCEPRQNAHILTCMLRFFLGSRLAF